MTVRDLWTAGRGDGHDPTEFDLWGDAVTTAADTAVDTIFYGSDPDVPRPPGGSPKVWVGHTGVVPVNAVDDFDIVYTFDPSGSTFTLTVTTTGQGTVAKDPDKVEYDPNEQVQLTASPAQGWSFGSWSGALTGTTNPDTVTMNANKTVNAAFTEDAPSSYTLTVNVVGQGSVTKTPDHATYDPDEQVQLEAVPASGWSFSGWSGDLTGTTNPDTVTMNANKEVTATFTEDGATADFVETWDVPNSAGLSGILTWHVPTGGWTKVDGQARSSSTSTNGGTLDTQLTNANMRAETEIQLTDVSSDGGLVLASDRDQVEFYQFEVARSGTIRIRKRTGGVMSSLATDTVTVGTGTFAIAFEHVNGALKAWINGVEVLTVTDPSPLTNRYVGIRHFHPAGGAQNWTGYNYFNAWDL